MHPLPPGASKLLARLAARSLPRMAALATSARPATAGFRSVLARVRTEPTVPPKAPETNAAKSERAEPRPPPKEPSDAALDAAARTVAQLGPPAPFATPPASPLAPPPLASPIVPGAPSPAAVETQTLALELLDRAAFWGDGVRGIARLRFGTKARSGLAGATITLEHDGERLVVHADDPDVEARLRARLSGDA